MNRTTTLGWLVMAAALVLGMSACSSGDDGVVGVPTPQPTVQTATTIHVTVGAGITDPTPNPSPTGAGSSATRSAVDYNTTTGKRTLKFTAGDCLYIDRDLPDGKNLAGELTMVGEPTNGGLNATFEGDVKVYASDGSETSYDFGGDDPLTGSVAILLHKDMAAGLYTEQTDKSLTIDPTLMVADDVATLMTTALCVSGSYDGSAYQLSTTATPVPILNCAFCGLDASASYQFQLKKDGDAVRTVTRSSDANGTATFAFASLVSGSGTWTLDVTKGGSAVGSIDFGTKDFTSTVYNVNRCYLGGEFTKEINLTDVHSDLTVTTGLTLTGRLLSYHKISIAPGATVTLSGATIPGADVDIKQIAGITCLGDATIVLADGTTNYVKGYHSNYPGIQAGPSGTTLTIRGTGTLTAETGKLTEGSTKEGYAAGIGGGKDKQVGNIRIEGGNITALGSYKGAGIGCGNADSGPASCGDITITGGNITATGGKFAAGIGSGGGDACTASCGNITIGDNVTGAATGGEGSPNDIGAGYYGSSGTVSVDDGTKISYVTEGNATCTFNFTFKKNGDNALVRTTDIAITGSAMARLTNNGDAIISGTSITTNMANMRSGTLTFTAICSNYPSGNAGTYTCTLENVRIAKNAANTFDVEMQWAHD